jgi:large-conductance mechanosensitive channel
MSEAPPGLPTASPLAADGAAAQPLCRRGNLVAQGNVTLGSILKAPALQFAMLYVGVAACLKLLLCLLDDFLLPVVSKLFWKERLQDRSIVLLKGDGDRRQPIAIHWGRIVRNALELIITVTFIVVSIRALVDWRCAL